MNWTPEELFASGLSLPEFLETKGHTFWEAPVLFGSIDGNAISWLLRINPVGRLKGPETWDNFYRVLSHVMRSAIAALQGEAS